MFLYFFLIGTFLLATMVQLTFWLGLFRRLAQYIPPPPAQHHFPPVSVIICARNEALQLQRFLPIILNQSYPNFEVIVVNDQSSDNSVQIILDFQKKYPILRLVEIKNKEQPGKKSALTQGILAASYENLLLTDADCFPFSNLWIHSMMNTIHHDSIITLGYSPYQKESGFLNAFIRFEALQVATQYFSFALAGMPYMGVGRNLAYPKHLFKANKGFLNHLHLASGDDDLFISEVANTNNTRINIDPNAFVFSLAKSNWQSYYNQKRRHLSTASSYSGRIQFLLGLLAWSHMWHYLGGLLTLALVPDVLLIIGISYLVRLGVVSSLLLRIMRKLHCRNLGYWIVPLDFCYGLYYLLFAPVLFITGSNYRTWT